MSLASSSTLLEDQDEDVRIAVRALGDMKSGNFGGSLSKTVATPASYLSSTSPISTTSIPSPTLSSLSISSISNHDAQLEPDFVSRMAHIPIVNGALRIYEQGKASSRVVKYGAEIMESGVKTISKPVIDRLPTGQLDEFACRQLDRLDKYRRSSQGASERQDPEEVRQALHSPTRVSQEDHNRKRKGDDVGRWVQMTSPSEIESSSQSLHSLTPTNSSYSRERYDVEENSPPADGSSSGAFHSPNDSSYDLAFDDQRRLSPAYKGSRPHQQPQDNQQQVVQRSSWQTMLLEAGGFSVAWSEESMRKLRYVLQWLQYATNHIDQQILAIRDFTESLQQHYFEAPVDPTTPINNRISSEQTSVHSPFVQEGHSRSSSESQSQAISSAHMHKLTSMRRDVIQTVREVVSVVSKYGGSAALPEPARKAMKSFILKLPKKVGEAMKMSGPSPEMHAGMSLAGGSNSGTGMERDSVAAAASGRARSDRRTAARRSARGDRGLIGSSSAAPSPMSSRTNSPAASPRMHPRGLHSATSSVSGFPDQQDQGISGFRHGPSTISAGTAVVAAQRILTLATESMDMMRGVTGVVRESLERADAWVERLKTIGVQRGDGSSNPQADSDRPTSSSSSSPMEMDRGRTNHDLASMHYVYRDSEDSALLSPLSLAGRSRRGSFGSSTGFDQRGGSLPATPGLTSYPSGPYVPSPFLHNGLSMDASGPEVGLGLRRMSIRGDEGDMVDVKKEEQEVEMDLDG
ncbi:Opi1-domain-containing protein [Lentinula edodes]|uniref:Opi1-domain-containing protein n=1 Tax=Lentinula edodes TaxID=5353 RepID=A0A1Q3E721_LENED|nr:Opi1-domain-containing protein [Lentinula edodes]